MTLRRGKGEDKGRPNQEKNDGDEAEKRIPKQITLAAVLNEVRLGLLRAS